MKQPTLRPLPRFENYEVVRDYEPDGLNETVVVPRGFRYDGASIPAAAWQLTYSPFHPDVMAAALVHDWLYYTQQFAREIADDLFYDILRANGVPKWTATAMWAAVRQFGELYWENDEDDDELLIALYRRLSRSRADLSRYGFPRDIVDRAER